MNLRHRDPKSRSLPTGLHPKIALSRILTSCNFGTADYAAVSRTVRWAVRYDVQQFIGWVAPGHLIGLSHALARYLTTLLPQPSVTLYSLVPSRKDGSRTHINHVSRDYRFSITEALTIKLLSYMPLAPVEAVDILAMSFFSLLLSLISDCRNTSYFFSFVNTFFLLFLEVPLYIKNIIFA